jgi:hypothetical protein
MLGGMFVKCEGPEGVHRGPAVGQVDAPDVITIEFVAAVSMDGAQINRLSRNEAR